MKKEREFFYLNEFKRNFPNFPMGDIYPDESPDFLIRCPNETIGIEITHFFREMSSATGPTLQQRESVRKKIIAIAKEAYNSKELPSVFVGVHFDLKFYCQKTNIRPIAEKLVGIVEKSLPDLDKERLWRRDEIQIGGVDLLSVKKMRGIKRSHWSAPLASFVPTIDPQQIQSILDAKNTRCTNYRKKCNRIWLIIVMERFQASSHSVIPEGIEELGYCHTFDSAFLFFYDPGEAQMPPYLLQNLSNIRH